MGARPIGRRPLLIMDPTVRSLRLPALLLAAAVVAVPAAAQRQFAESTKTYLPARRDLSRAIRTVDVDRDGDRDVLIGNNEITAGAQDRLLLNDGTGVFTDATATHLPVGLWHTNGFAVGDVDRDGDVDFVTGDNWQNRLYLNDGTGRFTDATFARLPVHGDETRDLELLDLDGDQDLDLVCANYRQEKLYLNDGSGFFVDVTATHLPVDAESTWALTFADIDADGDVDLCFGNYGQRRLYRNDGSARFTDVSATHLPPSPNDSAALQFADVDGDGDRDLFLGFWSGASQLCLNDGTGRFSDAPAGSVPPTKPLSWHAQFADFDADGDADLLYTTITEDQLFRNDGTGRFQDVSAANLPQLPSGTLECDIADLDGDLDLDIVTAEVAQQNRLWFNDGAGKFADATPERLATAWWGTLALALADLDGDGDLDLVTAAGDIGDFIEVDGVFMNDGRGNFTVAPSRLPSQRDDSRALAVGDVDGDGDRDLLFGNFEQQNRLYLNDGTGNFTDATATRLPAAIYPTTSLALGDVDGDGDRDLLVGNLDAPSRLWLNDGAGTFTDASAGRLPALVRQTRALALGDLDGDADLDLLLGNGLGNAQQEGVYINNGSGVFADETATRVPAFYNFPTASLALADVDADGDLDAIVGNDDVGLGRFNRLYVNDGAGRFTDSDLVYDYSRTLALAVGDVDGDGDADVVCGDHDSYDKLYLNDGRGRFSNWSWPRLGADRAYTRALALGDVDGDGDLDLVRGSDWLHPSVLINHHRQVWTPRLAKIGANWSVQVSGHAGYATAAASALPFLGVAPASLPLAPWGKLGVDPLGLTTLPLLTLPAPTGVATLTLPIPSAPGLVGQAFYVQALVLHGNNLADARFSNVLAERFVR